MKRSRLVLSIATLATLLALTAIAWSWLVGPIGGFHRRVVTVGLYENAPKVYTAENGRPSGLFVELMR